MSRLALHLHRVNYRRILEVNYPLFFQHSSRVRPEIQRKEENITYLLFLFHHFFKDGIKDLSKTEAKLTVTTLCCRFFDCVGRRHTGRIVKRPERRLPQPQ